MRITPYRAGEDRIKGVVMSFINITESKRAQEAVSKSEERLQQMVNIPNVGVITLDYSGKILQANDAFLKMTGVSREEFFAQKFTWADFTPPEHADNSLQVLEQLRITGQGGPYEKEYYRKDGSRVWLMFVGADLGDGLIVEYATDITKTKMTENSLRASEERMRVTMESAVDFSIITMNTERLIEQWNTGAERIFGFKAEEVIGKSADIIFTDEDRQKGEPEKEMQTAKEKGYAEDERWHQRKDGSRLFMSGVMRAIYNPELTGYVKIARDMTQHKLMEQHKDDFIGIASHELKTPVTSIKAYTEYLIETFKQNNDEESIDVINRLDTQVDRLTQLINSLFDTTKMSEGQLVLFVQQFNMHALIKEYTKELQRTTQNHKLIFSSTGDLYINADKERIIQVLVNLISNAIKYSPKGGDILINLEKKETGVQVSVKDKGLGIAQNIQDKIFERFYRADNPQISTYPGMGLGLYITATIIKRHGGKIWVESKPNEGAIFSFFLPY